MHPPLSLARQRTAAAHGVAVRMRAGYGPGVIAAEHLPDYLRCAADGAMAAPQPVSPPVAPQAFDSAGLRPGEHLEREHIVQMLACHHWRVKETAKALGMSRATIYRKMARYNIVYPGSASLPGSAPSSQADEAD